MRWSLKVAAAMGLAGTLSAALPQAASAQALDSAYTSFNTKTCPHRAGRDVEDYGRWTCRGLGGLAIRISAGDQRMQVSFGPVVKGDLAASQSLPAFNNVYEGTVEWRRRGGKPFATILRWNVITEKDRDTATGPITATGRVLVVTRLGPGGVCHVGYVDAVANADANILARRIADERATGFRCGVDRPVTLGKTEGGPLQGL